MMRAFSIGLAVVAAVIWAQGNSADAGPISRNNPYRSFNISGVNYGSTQWEIKHGKSSASNKSWSTGRRSGWFRRR